MQVYQNQTKQPIIIPVVVDEDHETRIKTVVDGQVVVTPLKTKRAKQKGVFYFPERIGTDSSRYTVYCTKAEAEKLEKHPSFEALLKSRAIIKLAYSGDPNKDGVTKAYQDKGAYVDPHSKTAQAGKSEK